MNESVKMTLSFIGDPSTLVVSEHRTSSKGAASMGWNWNRTQNDAVCTARDATRGTELPKPFGTKAIHQNP